MLSLPTIVGDRDPIMRAGRRAAVGVLVGAVLGTAFAGAWYLSRPVEYSSTVALELSAVAPLVDLNPVGATIDEVTVDTDAGLAASDQVVDAVAEETGLAPERVRDRIVVRARPLSRILEITYTTSASPDSARDGATSAAEALLDQREQLIVEPVRAYLSSVERATVDVQNHNEDKLSGDSAVGGVTVSRGQAALETRLERAQRYQVRLPQAGTVVASASTPDVRRGTIDVILMSGAGLGALLGFGVGLLWERRADRVGARP